MKIGIIGGGAAGCFAAANIGPEHEVLLFEKTGKLLQKVKVSGGGRCNVTHDCPDVRELLQRYPRGNALLRKSLNVFGPSETIEWFGRRGVRLKTEPDGRMFPSTDSSQTIIDALLAALRDNRTKVMLQHPVKAIEPKVHGFVLDFEGRDQVTVDRLLIATGGAPKDQSYDWLRDLGVAVQSPVPSLFTFNLGKHPITELMGVSVEAATAKIRGTKLEETGPLLITHWGFSGPAILRLSAWGARALAERNYDFELGINWIGQKEPEARDRLQDERTGQPRKSLRGLNLFGLPKRLWEFQLDAAGIPATVNCGDLSNAQINRLVARLTDDTYAIGGKTTFKEEFVTCGGIGLPEIDPATCESRKHPGLFFAGEVLDADGITGGFNFQHAWASGYLAAQHMMKAAVTG